MTLTKKFNRLAAIWWLCSISLCAASCAVPATSGISHSNDSPPKEIGQTSTLRIKKSSSLPNLGDCYNPSLQFIDETTGWLSCGDNLWQTRDGGTSWEHIYTGKRNNGHVTFFFSDAQNGWSATLNTLLNTKDGGHTWTPMASPTLEPKKGAILSVGFLKDGKRGWLIGGVYRPIPPSMRHLVSRRYTFDDKTALAGAIFYTEDGGVTWRQQEVPSPIATLFHQIYISDAQQVWALGDAGVYRLAGSRWIEIDAEKGRCANQFLLDIFGENAISDAKPDSIYFLDEKQGWMSFTNGYLTKTTDGGDTWCDLLDPKVLQYEQYETNHFIKIHFINGESGIGLDSNGVFHETNDGGATWVKISSNIKFQDMYFVSPNQGWAVAKEGVFRITPQ